jgi:hypothetical protein
VFDWAQFLDLMDSAAHLTPIGRLLATLPLLNVERLESWNPYVLGKERIIVAYQYFSRDIDLLTHFIPLLVTSEPPLTKSRCRELFVEALKACVATLDASKTATPRARSELFQQLRDLERSARRSRTPIQHTSTAWHRTASRVETLADIGLLTKGAQDDEKYKYVYYPTDRLRTAAKTLHSATEAQQWLEGHLVQVVLAPDGSENRSTESGYVLTLAEVRTVVDALQLPTTQLPIDCLALGMAFLNARASLHVSLGVMRQAIERLPTDYPDLARLARGRAGNRAEYISLNPKKLSAAI